MGVSCRAGCRVTLVDLSADALDHANTALQQFTQRSVDKGKLTQAERASAFDRLTFSSELAPSVADTEYDSTEHDNAEHHNTAEEN